MSQLRLQLEDAQKTVNYCLEILDRLQTPQPSALPPVKGGTHVPPLDVYGVISALAVAGFDASVLNVQVLDGRLVVSAKRWMDTGWDKYDAFLKNLGFKWVSAGRLSHWEGSS